MSIKRRPYTGHGRKLMGNTSHEAYWLLKGLWSDFCRIVARQFCEIGTSRRQGCHGRIRGKGLSRKSVETEFDWIVRWTKVPRTLGFANERSLIALALIMSLLQFKPAPMYILDEVDAALDLSHTQNIGRLIKTRFKGYVFKIFYLFQLPIYCGQFEGRDVYKCKSYLQNKIRGWYEFSYGKFRISGSKVFNGWI